MLHCIALHYITLHYITFRAEPIVGSATRFGRVSATRQYSVISRYKPAEPSIKNILSVSSRHRNDD